MSTVTPDDVLELTRPTTGTVNNVKRAYSDDLTTNRLPLLVVRQSL
jgi:hypothetical protein